MTLKKSFILIILIILFGGLYQITPQSSAKNPDQVMKDLITLFRSYHRKDKNSELTAAQIKENVVIGRQIGQIFDYPSLINGTLKDQLKIMSQKQQNDFYNMFKDLVELVAFPQGSYFYNNSNNTFKKAQYQDGKAYVFSENYNYDKDLEMTITYIYQQINNEWKLIDLEMNEHSLIEAYRLQVNRIVEKQGLEGLMSVLRKKHDNLVSK